MNYFIPKSRLRIALLGLFCCFDVFADFPHGVAAGETTQTSSVLWTRSTTIGELIFDIALDPEFNSLIGRYRASVIDSQIPVKLELDSLSPDTRYFYRVTDTVGVSAGGQFHTAASPGQRLGVRFGVAGDWRGELMPFSAIRNAKELSLDFFIKLGDTIYADVLSPALNKTQAETVGDFYSKYAEVYSQKGGLNSWADLHATTSVWATIDDHEVTDDFIGYADVSTDTRFNADPAGTFINESTLYKNGIQAFLDYHPIKSQTYDTSGTDPRTDGKVKFYRYQTYGDDAAVMLLDSRSFRDAGLSGSINPLSTNTLLGQRQLAELKKDLLDAEKKGVTWKFIAIPEPIQNLGSPGAEDRYEGFAGERAELLQFIKGYEIRNVVFITADIHGTLVNNLIYQSKAAKGLIHHATSAWEISTAAVAYSQPLGPSIIARAKDYGLPGVMTPEEFAQLSYTKQESYVLSLVNLLLRVNGYNTIGLNGSSIDAALILGRYAATTTYGWTEFQIEAITQKLTVTVWGINAYPIPLTADDFARIADQQPRIVSQFKVNPKPSRPNTAVKANLSTQITTSRKSTKIKQKIKYTAFLRNSGKGLAEKAVLNFNILENEADVVSLGKSCHRFAQIISCDLGNVKKQASRSIILKPLKPGDLKISVTVMTNSPASILPSIKTVTTKIIPN